MLVPTIIMAVLAIGLLIVGVARGQNEHIAGLKVGMSMTIEVLPLILFAFILAGMIQVLIPSQTIGRWIGPESGTRGIFIGTLAGILTPGGPYVSFPIVAGLLRAGSGIGTTVAFLTAWSLLGVSRLPIEVGLLGWRFAAIRILCTFFFPPIAGWIANLLFKGLGWRMGFLLLLITIMIR